jgi:hypothetical protein
MIISYTFHYLVENRIIYLCLSEKDFDNKIAYQYLGEVQKRFIAAYGENVQSAPALGMKEFSTQLSNLMV